MGKRFLKYLALVMFLLIIAQAADTPVNCLASETTGVLRNFNADNIYFDMDPSGNRIFFATNQKPLTDAFDCLEKRPMFGLYDLTQDESLILMQSPIGSYEDNCNANSDLEITNAIAIGTNTGIAFIKNTLTPTQISYVELMITNNENPAL